VPATSAGTLRRHLSGGARLSGVLDGAGVKTRLCTALVALAAGVAALVVAILLIRGVLA
jgi:hypothetical protein